VVYSCVGFFVLQEVPMHNSVVMLVLLAVVLAPFLGILYSVGTAYLNAPPPPADVNKH